MGKSKQTLKKVISLVLALALLVTGIQITPMSVDASMPSANGKMTYTDISGLSDGCTALRQVWYKNSSWSSVNPKMFFHKLTDKSKDGRRAFCLYLGGSAPTKKTKTTTKNGKKTTTTEVYIYKDNSSVANSYGNSVKNYFKSAIYFYYDPDNRWSNFSKDDRYVIAQTYIWRLLKMRSVKDHTFKGNVMGSKYSNNKVDFSDTLNAVYKEYSGSKNNSVVKAVETLVEMVENDDVRLDNTNLYFYHCGTDGSQPFLVGTASSVGSPTVKVEKSVAANNTSSSEIIDTGTALGLKRKDNTGGIVKGAVYSVSKGNSKVGTVTIGKNGSGSLSDNKLDYNQTVKVKEQSAPEGMDLNNKEYTLNIGVSSKTYTIKVNDQPHLYPLTIKKVDETGTALSNISFDIYAWNYNKNVYVKVKSGLTTNSNGEIKLAFYPYRANGKVNKIKIVETSTLKGYGLAASRELTIKNLNRNSNEIKFTNEPQKVSLTVEKVDKTLTNKKLPNTKFVLQSKNSNGTWSDLKEGTTNNSGIVTFNSINRSARNGFITYRIYEKTPPTNYSRNLDGSQGTYSKEFQFRDKSDSYWNNFDKSMYISQGDGQNASLKYVAKDQIDQKQINLKVKLTDSVSNESLDDADFELQRCAYNANGTKTWSKIASGTTKSGIIDFGKVDTIDGTSTLTDKRGTFIDYRLVEKTIPKHYIADGATVKKSSDGTVMSDVFNLPSTISSYNNIYLTATANGSDISAIYNAKNELLKANVSVQKTAGYISGTNFKLMNDVFLNNAEYTVYGEDKNTVITKFYTDSDGYGKSNNIILDNETDNVYYIQETKSSMGTDPILGTKVKITLNHKQNLKLNGLNDNENTNDKDKNKVVTQEPWSTSFQLKKIDGYTKKPIYGVVFRLVTKGTGTTKVIKDYTTNVNGIIRISDDVLYYSSENQGEFELYEISAPEDYQINRAKINIKITGKDTSLVNSENNTYTVGSDNYYTFENKQIGGNLTIQKVASNQLGKQLITGTTNITATNNTVVDSDLNYGDFKYGLYKYNKATGKAGELYSEIDLKKGIVNVPKRDGKDYDTAERGIGELKSIPVGQYVLKEISTGNRFAENNGSLVIDIGTGDNLIYDGELGLSKDDGETYDSSVFDSNTTSTKSVSRVSKFITNAIKSSLAVNTNQTTDADTTKNNTKEEKRTIDDVKKNWETLTSGTFDKIVINSDEKELSKWAKSLNKKEVKAAKVMSNTLGSDKTTTTFKDGKATSTKSVNYMTSLLNDDGISTQALNSAGFVDVYVRISGADLTIAGTTIAQYGNNATKTIQFRINRWSDTNNGGALSYTLTQTGNDNRISSATVDSNGHLRLNLRQPVQTKLNVVTNKNFAKVVNSTATEAFSNLTDISSSFKNETISKQTPLSMFVAPNWITNSQKITGVYINFSPRYGKLTFDANGGTYENEVWYGYGGVKKYGSSVATRFCMANIYPFGMENPVRDGYTFKGYKVVKPSNSNGTLTATANNHPGVANASYIYFNSDYLLTGYQSSNSQYYIPDDEKITLRAIWKKNEDTLEVKGNVLRNTLLSDQIVIDTIDLEGNSITGASFNVSHDGKTSDINDNQILGIKNYDGFISTKKEIKQSIAPFGYTTVNHFPNDCKIDTILIPYYANKAGFDCDKGYYVKGRLYKAGDLVRYNDKWYVCTNKNGVVTTASSPSSNEFKEAVDSEYKSEYGLDLSDIKDGASVWNKNVKCVREHIIYYVNDKSSVNKSLKIRKVDSNNELLNNAGFTLSIKNGDKIATVNKMTNSVNAYVFNKLIKQSDIEQYGTTKSDGSKELTYVVEETTVPFGYKKCDNVEVKAVLKDNEITLYDKNGNIIDDDQPIKLVDEILKLNISLKKTGDSSACLSGAVYGVYSDPACTNKVSEIKVDKNGYGSATGLVLGTYYVKEIQSPGNGLYNLDKQTYRIDGHSLYNNNKNVATYTASITSTDKLKTGSINIIKYLYNDDTKNPNNVSPLQYVGFTAYFLGNKEFIDSSKVLYVKSTDEIPGDKTYQTFTDYKKSPKNVDYIIVTDTDISRLTSAGSLTTGKDGTGSINNLKYGCYVLKETSVPTGVEVNTLDPQIIDVNEVSSNTDNPIKLYNENFYYPLTIKKTDDDKNALPNAVFEILDSNKNRVGNNYTTNKNGIITTNPLKAGKYYVREVKSPLNCLTETKEVEVTINRAAVKSNKIEVEISNTLTNVKFSKVDIKDKSKELPGGHFSVYNSMDEKVYEWEHGSKAYEIKGISKAEDTTDDTDYVIYKLVEDEAPDGYLIADPILFALDDKGNVYTISYDKDNNIKYTKAEGNTIVMADKHQTNITVSKYAVNTKDELNGGSFIITDELNDTIAQWSHDGKAYEINNLRQAETEGKYVEYTLTEIESPNGYLIANPITFAVDYYGDVYKVITKDGNKTYELIKDNHIIMEDTPSNVSIENVEKNNHGKYVENAKFVIYDTNDAVDDNGNIKEVVNITTTTKPNEIIGKLQPNHEYCIIETETPTGYFDAEPITFKIGNDGYVYINDAKVNNNLITIESDFTKININLKDKNTDKYLPNAKMELYYYVPDEEDNETEVEEKKLVASWTSKEQAHYIEKLLPGRYELVEKEEPNGYVPTDSIVFDIEETGDTQEVTMHNDYTRIQFSKTNSVTGDYVSDAKVSLYEATVSDEKVTKGTLIDSFTTSDKPYTRTKLKYGQTYVFVEDEAPYGYSKAADIVFKAGYGTIDITGTEKTDNRDLANNLTEGIKGPADQDEPTTSNGEMEANAVKNDAGSKEYKVGSNVLEMNMVDAPILVDIEKIDDNDAEVYGAKLKIVKLVNGKEDKNSAYEWVTDMQGSPQAPIFEDGTYLITETETPNGHARATDKILTIDNGSVEVREEVTGATISGTLSNNNTTLKGESDTLSVDIIDGVIYIRMIDEIMNVNVTNINNKNENVAGGHFQVIDEDGNVVDDWVQGDNAHTTNALVCGATYTLHEVTPSDGYYSTEDKTFTTKKGENNIVFRSYPTKVYISKTGTRNAKKNRIGGATLQLIDKSGNIVQEFITSDSEDKLITNIPVGEYTLREAKNAIGYNYAKDIKIYVGGKSGNGEFKLDKIKDNITEYKKYTTEEDFINNNYASLQEMFDSRLRVLKINENGICLDGAKLQIIKIDNNNKGTIVKEFTSSSNGNTVDGLKPGDYILREVEPPTNYDISDDISFTITGAKDLTIRMNDELIKPLDTGKFIIPGIGIILLAGGVILIALRRKRKQMA